MKSIISDKKECYFCHSQNWIEEHHIFGGAMRKKSEKYGLKVYLCHFCHNEPPNGIHHNAGRNLHLKQLGQRAFKKTYPDKDFRAEFYKNYLEENHD